MRIRYCNLKEIPWEPKLCIGCEKANFEDPEWIPFDCDFCGQKQFLPHQVKLEKPIIPSLDYKYIEKNKIN